jgi:hypothetical protein
VITNSHRHIHADLLGFPGKEHDFLSLLHFLHGVLPALGGLSTFNFILSHSYFILHKFGFRLSSTSLWSISCSSLQSKCNEYLLTLPFSTCTTFLGGTILPRQYLSSFSVYVLHIRLTSTVSKRTEHVTILSWAILCCPFSWLQSLFTHGCEI